MLLLSKGNRLKQIKTLSIATALLFTAFLYNNCSKSFEASNSFEEASTSAAVVDAAPAKLVIVAPTHTPERKCSEEIVLAAPSSLPDDSVITFPDYLSGKLFKDNKCNEQLDFSNINASQLPLKLYFRSVTLFQKPIFANVNGSRSNEVLLSAYRPQLMNANLGDSKVYLRNGFSERVSVIDVLPFSSSNLFTPPIVVQDTGSQLTGPLISAPSGLRLLGFDKTHVQSGGSVRIPTVATLIAEASNGGNNKNRCYVAMNEVFCSNGIIENFKKINLPAGDVLDLSMTSNSATCAVVSGSVYCWQDDQFVVSVRQFGNDVSKIFIARLPRHTSSVSPDANASITVQQALLRSSIFVIKRGSVFHLQNGALTALASNYSGAESISGANSVLPFLVIQRKIEYYKDSFIYNFRTGQEYFIPSEFDFDEIYVLSERSVIANAPGVAGCGRIGQRLVCFSGFSDPSPELEVRVIN